MYKSPACFFGFLLLLFCSRTALAQFTGGIADAHANARLNNVVCVVINTNPFLGGSANGAANSRIVNISCTVINANPFIGGSGGGFAAAGITNISCITVNANPFLGGIGDGHADMSVVNVICVPVNANPFLGGIGDGHSNERLTNITCIPVNVNPFLGGIADGHAMAYVQNVTCVPVNVNPFTGGFADGHANMRMVNINCTVVNVNPFLGGVASGHSFKSLTNILCGVSSLPIQLIFFKAIPDGDKVQLTWETASETNNDYFTVERANENMSFEKILRVNGSGNSSDFSYYDAADENPFRGVSYYRLKQTDFNGLYSYSQTEQVTFVNRTTTSISPNPITEDKKITVTYESQDDGQIGIRVRDALGVLACSYDKTVSKGANKFLLKLPVLSYGMYFVDILSASKTETLKLVVDN